jgi:HEAT repeat protein
MMLVAALPLSSTVRAVDTDPFGLHAKEALQPLAKRLQTHDQTELIMVLDELAPGPEADRNAHAVAELLRAGQTDVVTDHALAALARLRSREGRDVSILFLRHRRPEARYRAYEALALLHDTRDLGLVAQGLRDSAPQVRGDAARQLGELRARGASADLLRALELGVHEASGAIGKVGDAASLERFNAQLGKLPLTEMLDGYANYLERPDLPDSSKLHIIAVLEEVSGGVVKDFLNTWLTRPRPNASPQLQQAITASVARIVRQDIGTPAARAGTGSTEARP